MSSKKNKRKQRKRIQMVIAYAKTNGHCFYCGIPLVFKQHQTWDCDHWIPLSKGGRNDHSNLVPACKQCNNLKGSLDPVTFFKKRIHLTQQKKKSNSKHPHSITMTVYFPTNDSKDKIIKYH